MEAAAEWVNQIAFTIYQDKDDLQIAEELREIDQCLRTNPSLYCIVCDRLAQMKVITKAEYKAYLETRDPRL